MKHIVKFESVNSAEGWLIDNPFLCAIINEQIEIPITFYCDEEGKVIHVDEHGNLVPVNTEIVSKLYLNNGDIIECYGETITQDMIYNNRSTLIKAEIGNGVTRIASYAFYNCSNLVDVILPDTLTTIENYAFGYCSKLENINIPDSVVNINRATYVFYNCTSLPVIDNIRYADTICVGAVDKSQETYTVKEGTRFICYYAFSECSNATAITLPNTILTICNYAFQNCSKLESINIPTVTYIGEYSFSGCSVLDNIVISNNVVTIGGYAFNNCTGLSTISISNNVSTIGSSAFNNCTSLPVIDNVRYADIYCIGAVDKTQTSYSIKSGTKWIGYNAFNGCSELLSITLPNSVDSIDQRIFYNCSKLTSVTLSSNLTKISNYMFYECAALTSITIPYGVLSINDYAFYNCKGLVTISIPETVTTIGSYAFYGCEALINLVLPNGLVNIGSQAFYGCKGLTSIDIPEGTTSIGGYAFQGCTELTSIDIPDTVTTIGTSAFNGCTSLTDVEIPESVTTIGGSAFQNCTSLTSITIPSTVTSIGGSAFQGCTSLTDVTISNGVATIGGSTFYNCEGLTSIYIPASVTNIGTYVFYNCSGITSITVDPNNTVYDSRNNCNAIIETLSNNLIYGCKTTIIPNDIVKIESNAFAKCTGLISITIPNSVNEIGDNAFSGCTGLPIIDNIRYADTYCIGQVNKEQACGQIKQGTKWIGSYAFDQSTTVTSMTLPNTVIYISNYAFNRCTNLTTLALNEGITYIGSYAFGRCERLQSITIPSTVTYVGYGILDGCTGLKTLTILGGNNGDTIENWLDVGYSDSSNIETVVIGNNIKRIGYYAFYNCPRLSSITFGSGVEYVDDYAFSKDKCTSLPVTNYVRYADTYCLGATDKNQTTYSIKEGTKFIAASAFYRCTKATSIPIPSSVIYIGSNAFGSCTSLPVINGIRYNGTYLIGPTNKNQTTYTIEEGTKWLGHSSFYNCTKATSIPIPSSVEIIDAGAFYSCLALTNIIIPNTVTTIKEDAFGNCKGLVSITIPASATSIDRSFLDCSRGQDETRYTSLTTIVVDSNNPVYDSRNNCNALIETATNKLLKACDTTVIPNTVTSISEYAFSDCHNMRILTIPNSVTNIDEYALYRDEEWGYGGSLEKIIVAETEYKFNGDYEIIIKLANGTEVTLCIWSQAHCFVKDTLITMSDGSTKPVQDISYKDVLKVWDFDNGNYSSAKPIWIKKTETTERYSVCKFSDGTELKFVGHIIGDTYKAHRVFNYTDQRFDYPQDCIGKQVFTENGIVTLVSCENIYETVENYNIITKYHINLFANGVLTSCRYNNIYPIENMMFVKDERELIPYETYYSEIPEIYYEGMRLGEQTINPVETIKYIKELIKTKKNEHLEPWERDE